MFDLEDIFAQVLTSAFYLDATAVLVVVFAVAACAMIGLKATRKARDLRYVETSPRDLSSRDWRQAA